MSDHEYVRAEFDWLAIDRRGAFGFFASGGYGPVPAASLEVADRLLDIQESIYAIPSFSKTECVANVEYYLGDFFGVAERGLYAYNWDFAAKSYRLIVKPFVAATSERLGDVAALGRIVRLPVLFEESPWIDSRIETDEPGAAGNIDAR